MLFPDVQLNELNYIPTSHTKLVESQLILAQSGFPACAWMILLSLAKWLVRVRAKTKIVWILEGVQRMMRMEINHYKLEENTYT